MEPIYKEIWDYIANSSSAAQAVMLGISAAAVYLGYSAISSCSKLNNLRKQKKSKLESEVKGGNQ